MAKARFNFILITKASEEAKKISQWCLRVLRAKYFELKTCSVFVLQEEENKVWSNRGKTCLQRSITEAPSIDESSTHCIFHRGRIDGKFRGNTSADSVA